MNDCQYTPQIFTNKSPMSPTLPVLTKIDYVRFTYPYITPTLTVDLPTPEFNNNIVVRINRLARETRGKTLNVSRYSLWPKYKRLSMNFMLISQEKANSILDFLIVSAGKDIGYLDFESRQWKGLILNPEQTISQEAPGCGFSVKIDFEGELV